jgi:hypothetical protein
MTPAEARAILEPLQDDPCEDCLDAFTCSRCESDCDCPVPPACPYHAAVAALVSFDRIPANFYPTADRHRAERETLLDAIDEALDPSGPCADCDRSYGPGSRCRCDDSGPSPAFDLSLNR